MIRPAFIIAAIVASPKLALAQAAVQSDTPVPQHSEDLGAGTLPRSSGAARDAGMPNPMTGPGSPGTTGTGTAGTGPTGTMAAPGR